MIADKLTAEHIKAYAKYMAKEFDLIFASDMTRAIKETIRKAILRLNPSVDIDAYFARWAFTVNNFVWVPFSVENPKPIPFWSFPQQLLVIAHEATHVEQAKREGFLVFAANYLGDEESRGQYEYEACRTEMEIAPVLFDGAGLEPADLVKPLVHYGCTQKTIEFVESQLRTAKQQGGVMNRASKVTISWLADNVKV
jgi:hypothetical protein